jgi:hypothetical protein
VILGFYAGKSHNLIGLGIFHGDLDFFDLHEKSLYLSYYEIFPHKILKSRTFKKSSGILIVLKNATPNAYLYCISVIVKFGDQNRELVAEQPACILTGMLETKAGRDFSMTSSPSPSCPVSPCKRGHTVVRQSLYQRPVLEIRLEINTDPDTAFQVNSDSDSGSGF